NGCGHEAPQQRSWRRRSDPLRDRVVATTRSGLARGRGLFDGGTGKSAVRDVQWKWDYPLKTTFRKKKKRKPESTMAEGRVRTQASPRLRTVLICRPEWLAIMVPATPDDSTCVVLTGKPKPSAA